MTPLGFRFGRKRPRGWIALGLAWRPSTNRASPGRSRSSGRTRFRRSAPTGRQRSKPRQDRLLGAKTSVAPANEVFVAEAGRIAEEISSHAIRRGSSAAWIGLDWLGDSEVSQLVPLGLDLYNGVAGIAVFLAAHAACARSELLGRTCARRRLALAQDAAQPKRRARRALSRARRRDRSGFHRLRPDADVEIPWRRRFARRRACGGGLVHGRPHRGRQTIRRHGRRRRRDSRVASALSRHPIRRSAQARRRSAANTCFVNLDWDRKAVAVGSDRVLAGERSTACRTAPRASPMRSLPWRRRRGARISPMRQRSA